VETLSVIRNDKVGRMRIDLVGTPDELLQLELALMLHLRKPRFPRLARLFARAAKAVCMLSPPIQSAAPTPHPQVAL
jgi:hypothetical protein